MSLISSIVMLVEGNARVGMSQIERIFWIEMSHIGIGLIETPMIVSR